MVKENSLEKIISKTIYLNLGATARKMVEYLCSLEQGDNKKQDYKKTIEECTNFLERADIWINEPLESRSRNLINNIESGFITENFVKDTKELTQIKRILNLIKYDIPPNKEEIENLLKFYDKQICYFKDKFNK